MKIIDDIHEAERFISEGKIIAYPTECVYGLGCDPFNSRAVRNLLQLKKRNEKKGLILIISSWEQLPALIGDVPEEKLEKVKASWPGQVTWVFPKSVKISNLISGHYPSVAIRMSNHPIAKMLCKNMPIVSTSANISNFDPAKTIDALEAQFPVGIDGIVSGDLGDSPSTSPIFDVLTDKKLR